MSCGSVFVFPQRLSQFLGCFQEVSIPADIPNVQSTAIYYPGNLGSGISEGVLEGPNGIYSARGERVAAAKAHGNTDFFSERIFPIFLQSKTTVQPQLGLG